LQKVLLNIEPESDPFLTAVGKIRKEQNNKAQDLEKREKLREKNASRWKEILDKKEIEEFEQYREDKNSQRLPINFVEGVSIEVQDKIKKSAKKDFRNLSQFITSEKNPNERTEFDDLPRIKTTEVDAMIQDENPQKKNIQKRVWDKTKKNFVWQKDREDRLSKTETGKKAYQIWKKKSHLAIPKAGDMEDQEKTQQAQDSWKNRRMARHGWRENKPQG